MFRFLIKYCLVLLLLIACKEENKEVGPSEIETKQENFRASTSRMIDSIAKIKSKVNFRNHLYESEENLKLVEQEFNKAISEKKLTTKIAREYANSLLLAGRSQDAIDMFEKIINRIGATKVDAKNKNLFDDLAISYMRLGEQINCRDNHSEESCLFPIKGSGIHSKKEGSQKAIAIYNKILEAFPDDLQSRWLLNLAYMTLGEYPENVPKKYLIPPKVFQSEYAMAEFKNISMNVGLDVNELAGGVITDDFNNDGYLDVMVSSWGLSGKLHYFESNGDGHYPEKTEISGLNGLTGGLNMIQADYNNDGHLDFYVLRGAWYSRKIMGQLPNSLLRNNGDGTFTDVTIESGIYGAQPTHSAVWADFNADGWLDLYVGNETHTLEEPYPAQFFLSQRDGTFIDIAPKLKLDKMAFIKGVTAGDVNNDGLPDIYISILNRPNKLLINRSQPGSNELSFEDMSEYANVQNPERSFPCWFFDYNNDGWEDIFVTCYDTFSLREQAREVAADYLREKVRSDLPRLYQNNGNGSFSNITKQASLDHILPTMGCNYGDLDNDGFLDFYLGTGAPDYRSVVPNRMFRNNAGKSFQDVTYAGNFGHVQKGHGVSFADLDGDGDQDIYTVMGGAVSGDIFQNALFENPGNSNNWITIRLEGTQSNRSAIGARIRVTIKSMDGSSKEIYNTLSSGGSFGSNSLQAEIGLGEGAQIENIAINWPNGKHEYVDYGSVPTNAVIQITEGKTAIKQLEQMKFSFPTEHHSMSH